MADYTPPPPDEVDFLFRGAAYVPPAADELLFIFGAEDQDGPETGLLRANYMILLTI